MVETMFEHGYVRVVEGWGSDQAIIEAARMSTQKGFLRWDDALILDDGSEAHVAKDDFDRVKCLLGQGKRIYASNDRQVVDTRAGDVRLLRYLWKNNHATPFEMGGLIVEVRAPIIVFREWHRHRTQSYSEASARYGPLPALDYVPTVDRLMMGGGHLTKQAAATDDAEPLTEENAQLFRERLERWQSEGEDLYKWALKAGIPKELARLSMTVGRFSTMRASANLRNWIGFERLRDAPQAQYEIQVYARAVGRLLKERFPRTWALFEEERSA